MRSTLLTALVLVVLSGCSADVSDTPVRPGPTAGPATKDVILRGTVLDDGQPVEDASLWIELMPVADIVAELPEGATVETWSTEPVSTDEHGRYSMRIDPDELGPTFFGGDFLNTDIHVEKGRVIAFWGHPFTWVDEVWRSDEHSSVDDALTQMTFDLGRERVTTVLSTGEEEKSELVVGR